MLLAMDADHLEALEILRADICRLFPPGPVRERWLAWAELVAAEASLLTNLAACGHERPVASTR